MIRALFILAVPLVYGQAFAGEIAIKCKSENTIFAVSPGSQPSVKSELAPDQTFILDEEKQLVWRWLAPLNKRDQLCNDPTCSKTFTNTSIDLFWQPESDVFRWEWGLQLDRITGHGLSYYQLSRTDEMEHVRTDMMCSPTAVPVPTMPTRAF